VQSGGIRCDWDDWTASIFELACCCDGLQVAGDLDAKSDVECLLVQVFAIEIDEKNMRL
jgi:hypothetical protein